MKRDNGESTAIVSLQHVDARIEQQLILRNVSLVLRRGEHLGIVGANGSGKTTLLRLIGGTHWPAPGSGTRSYCFDHRSHRDAVEARKRITLVGPELQDAYVRLGWNFTAAAVVVTGLHRTEIPRRTITRSDLDQATKLLDALEAGSLSDRPFFELSRGEQRRVLIARALAFRSEVLLLDEPASGLDAAARSDLDRAIERAAQQATIVATAHCVEALPRTIRSVVAVRAQAVFPIQYSRRQTIPGASQRTGKTQRFRNAPVERPAVAELHNATVWVGDRAVLRNVNWRLEQDEHWLVTGNNGAGKSTFLRLLHGQIRPAIGGTIRWPALGNPRNIWELRRSIGWVSPELQADYRYPSTVAQCVASGFHSSVGQTRPLSASEQERCDSLLAGFRLSELRHRRLSKLSYGQARRALLARTLASAPRLLLLDEPWEGLDPEAIGIVLEQLLAAKSAGTAIVCASHIGDAGLGLGKTMLIADGAIHVCENS